jgi:hypothetical protein
MWKSNWKMLVQLTFWWEEVFSLDKKQCQRNTTDFQPQLVWCSSFGAQSVFFTESPPASQLHYHGSSRGFHTQRGQQPAWRSGLDHCSGISLFLGSGELIKMPKISSHRKSPCCTFSVWDEMKAIFCRWGSLPQNPFWGEWTKGHFCFLLWVQCFLPVSPLSKTIH